MTFHLHREDMEEEVIIHEQGSLEIRIRHAGSEDRTPDRRLRNAPEDSFSHLSLSLRPRDCKEVRA